MTAAGPNKRISEYGYSSGELGCASSYILPVLSRHIRKLQPGSVVMDLGCGNGSVLAQFRGLGLDLYGLEVSTSGVASAQREYPEVDVKFADLTTDLSGHPLAGKCDFVIST